MQLGAVHDPGRVESSEDEQEEGKEGEEEGPGEGPGHGDDGFDAGWLANTASQEVADGEISFASTRTDVDNLVPAEDEDSEDNWESGDDAWEPPYACSKGKLSLTRQFFIRN